MSKVEVFLRRLLFTLLFAFVVSLGVWQAIDILMANDLSWLEVVMLAIFTTSFSVISISFIQGLIGFFICLFSKDPVSFSAPFAKTRFKKRPLTSRTALLAPMYCEDPNRVCAMFEAIFKSFSDPAQLAAFDWFILSDTPDAERGSLEELVVQKLRDRLGNQAQIIYRRRLENTGKKAGNIWDFCERWGDSYDYKIVLDADSLMSAETILQLVHMMEDSPQTGIIQTTPRLIYSSTTFARMLQFGHRLCVDLLAAGSCFWQLDAGNYHGHNAIIRIAPFKKHCSLPVLSGRGPLSGEILSHDFVEAAYMRRAGFGVWTIPLGEGSFEELPSNLLDYAKRDRRWCQGNLQHSRILIEAGLHPISRFHLFSGILAYLCSPLWMLMLAITVGKLSYEALTLPVYFPESYSLFPDWPEVRTAETLRLFLITFVMLLSPKLLGMLLVMLSSEKCSKFGGRLRLLFSLAFEVVFSMLIAPVMMVFHTLFVISILCGKTISWNAQPRGPRGLALRESLACLKWQVFSGILFLVSVMLLIPEHIFWLAPVIAGLLLAVPLVSLSSRIDLAKILHFLKLGSTPEDLLPALVQSTAADQ